MLLYKSSIAFLTFNRAGSPVPISDFVAYSYGESWDSSCEKSRVPVQNQWVPVKKKRVRNWKCLGHYVTRQLIWSTDSKTLYHSILKLKYSPSILKLNKSLKNCASLNTTHNICLRNYTKGIFWQIHMLRWIDLCVPRDACHLWGFSCVRTKNAEVTNSLLYTIILFFGKRRPLYVWEGYIPLALRFNTCKRGRYSTNTK